MGHTDLNWHGGNNKVFKKTWKLVLGPNLPGTGPRDGRHDFPVEFGVVGEF